MDFLGTTTVLLIASAIFLLLSFAWSNKQKMPGRMPPGPTPLPILGNILQLGGKEFLKSLRKLSEKYGPVYTIHLGMKPVVVLYSCEVVKEALIDNGDEFGSRGHLALLEKIDSGSHGIINSNGEHWKILRRFCLMALRNFELGNKSIEERIQEEAQFLIEELRKSKGQLLDPTIYLTKAVLNVICSVVFGDRFDYEDKAYLHLIGILYKLLKGFSSAGMQMYNIFPKVVGKMPGLHQEFFNNVDEIKKFILERVKMHKEKLDICSPQGFIDNFLIKMEQEKDKPESGFHMDSLVNTTFDLLSAGTETVSGTLRYGLMILLKHPEVEERIQKEIDNVIGRNRASSLDDRTHMPYMDAVIHEIQRFIDLIPMAIPHKVTQDLPFRDFVIPKDTTVYPVLSSVLHDPKQFNHPNDFNPGHFLDDKGNFCRNDGFMPFSSGKRICAGEGLARMELFLFFSTILQNFSLRSLMNPEEIDLTPLMSGFGNYPRYYQLSFIPR